MRSWSHEIQVNPAKLTKTWKTPRNSVEILSNTCLYNIIIWNLFQLLWCYLLAVNLQIYLRTSSLKGANSIPKLPGADYVAKNWALAIMLKALPLVHFLSIYCCWKSKIMMTSVRKTLKTLVCSVQNQLISSEICLESNRKIACFLPIAFWWSLPRKLPRNYHKIGRFFCEFVPNNPAKFDFFFRDLSEALLKGLCDTSVWFILLTMPVSTWRI